MNCEKIKNYTENLFMQNLVNDTRFKEHYNRFSENIISDIKKTIVKSRLIYGQRNHNFFCSLNKK